MERHYDHDEFEQFLQDSANELRMRPSAEVWKNLSKELSRKRRRITGAVVLMLLLVTAGYFVWYNTSITTPLTDSSATTSDATSQSIVVLPKDIIPTVVTPTTVTTNNQRQVSIKENDVAPTIARHPLVNTLPTQLQNIGNTTDISASVTTPEITLLPELRSPARSLDVLPMQEKSAAPALLTPDALGSATATAPTIKLLPRLRRWSLQLFITPAVSYRKLADNKDYRRPILTPGIPANVSALYNVNNAVTHKPDMGVEVGLMARHAITPNLRFRTGLQFNVSRYDIRAFSYVPEVATIALNNGFWTDSVRTISNYRNITGGRSNWLQNIYFQASLPVGMELQVLGNNKNSFGIASSIQPTYLIGNRAYAITADYKNYARVPWLTRKWNMNTNLEAFVTLRNRKTEWQVGPQVRYQLLSSFIQEYPVKENLFDYGVKVGVKLK